MLSTMAMVRAQIQFERSQYEQIRMLARRKRISISEVVRRLVSAGIRHGADEEPSTGAAALLEIAGIGNSGKSDVAGRHDEHLARQLEDELGLR
jgi:hypothetical protein